jgi:hypothetical protein
LATPADWRDLLVRRLDARWGQLKKYDDYYEGNQTLAYITERARRLYGGLFADLSDNWCQIVVDAPVERLHVQGFRFGNDQEADEEAWAIWQANNLDGESDMLHTEAVKLSEAYWMVQPGDPPRITAEHPSQVIVACDPSDRRLRQAALKKWKGDDGYTYANVYLPDRVIKYRTNRMAGYWDGGNFIADYRALKWETIGGMSNPLGVVPVIPAPNRPSMLYGGRSELSGGILSIQDAINKELADMLLGSEYTALRQRVIMGIDQPRDPSTGKPVPLDPQAIEDQSRNSSLWLFPGKDGKAFEFSANDLENFRKAIDGLVRDLTAQTRTPPHYVAGQIVNASGDALKAAETGLVSKVRDKMVPFGEAHEEAMRLAFRALDPNDPRAEATDAETIWRDPESRSQAEVVDAATKKQALGVPWEQLMEDIGYSPQQIDRMAAQREAEALTAESFAPPVPPNGQPPNAATPGQTPNAQAASESP